MLIPSLGKNMCESICSNWTYTHIFLMQQDVKYFRFCCECWKAEKAFTNRMFKAWFQMRLYLSLDTKGQITISKKIQRIYNNTSTCWSCKFAYANKSWDLLSAHLPLPNTDWSLCASLILRTKESNSIAGLTGGELDREEGQSRGRA